MNRFLCSTNRWLASTREPLTLSPPVSGRSTNPSGLRHSTSWPGANAGVPAVQRGPHTGFQPVPSSVGAVAVQNPGMMTFVYCCVVPSGVWNGFIALQPQPSPWA